MATSRNLDEAGGMDLGKEIFGPFLETVDIGTAKVKAAIADGDGGSLGTAARVLRSSIANA